MILSICDSADVLSALRIVKIFIQFARIAIPIMLIVSISLDFFSAMTNGDSDALSRAARNSVSRAIATVVIFFIPQIISMTVSLATEDDSYKVCIKSATIENISKAYTEEATIYLQDAEKNLSRSVAVVTNEFHQYRSGIYASRCRLKAAAINVRTTKMMYPTLFVREVFAIVKCWISK